MILLLLTACPVRKDALDDTGTTDTHETDADTDADTDTDTDTDVEPGSLANADAVIVGAAADAAANAVAAAGDLDGDGFADVVVAAYYGNHACVFPGPIAEGRATLADAPTCFTGEGRYDFLGYSADGVGDATGDGVDDLLLGAIGNADMGTNAGKVYLLPGPFDTGVLAAAAEAHVAWVGEASGDYLGVAVHAVGDLDDDGSPELGIGASGNDGAGAGGGKLYLVHTPVASGGVLRAADAAVSVTGLPLGGAPPPPHGSYGGGDAVGDAFAGPGDVTGDGVDDLLVGGAGDGTYGSNTGKAAVFWGPLADGVVSVADADLTLYGSVVGGYAGSPVAAAGDTNGDGFADYLVASDGRDGGTVFLVQGSTASVSDDLLIGSATQFKAEAADDQAGYAVAGGGDVNGDGVPDVLIGAPGHDLPPPGCDPDGATGDRYDAGTAYVVLGPFPEGAVDLGSVQAWGGECAGDNAGRAVAFAGDVDGNGVGDALFGAIYNDDGGQFAGKAYLFYSDATGD